MIFLTRLFASIILLTEYAIEIVTEKGSPSGTAITIMIIPSIINPITSFNVKKHTRHYFFKIIIKLFTLFFYFFILCNRALIYLYLLYYLTYLLSYIIRQYLFL